MKTSDLAAFLRRQLVATRKEPIGTIQLRHAGMNMKGQIVEAFDHESVTVDGIESLAEDILSRAQTDADGSGGGVHRYEVVVTGVEEKRTLARFAFRVRSEDQDFDGESGEESASLKGIVTQLMRHNEAISRTMIQGVGALVQQLSIRVEKDSLTIDKLLDKRNQDFETIEDARSRENDRELEQLRFAQGREREQWAIGKVEALFPLIIAKISGKPLTTTQERTVLKTFIDSLTQEQFMALAKQLTQEQQISLFAIVKEIKGLDAGNGVSS